MDKAEQETAARQHLENLIATARSELIPPSATWRSRTSFGFDSALEALQKVQAVTPKDVADFKKQREELLGSANDGTSKHAALGDIRYNLTWARIWCGAVLAGGAAFVFATLIATRTDINADALGALIILLGVCDLAYLVFRQKAYGKAKTLDGILDHARLVDTAALSFGLVGVVLGALVVAQPFDSFASIGEGSGWWWALVGVAAFVAFLAAWQRQGVEHEILGIDEKIAALEMGR
jgi:hypothetical protein